MVEVSDCICSVTEPAGWFGHVQLTNENSYIYLTRSFKDVLNQKSEGGQMSIWLKPAPADGRDVSKPQHLT